MRLPLLASLALFVTCPAALAQDISDADVANLLDAKPLAILKNAPRVAVAGFRVGFVTRNKATARASAGFSNLGGGSRVTQGANASVEVTLENIDTARMQAIADQAYAGFMAALQASGREVVPMAEMRASAGWQQLEPSPTDKPYDVSPVGVQKHYRVVSPQALPLWFGHFDTPMGDRGPFALGNWRALNQLSVDTNAVVVVPQLIVDFASVTSSGNSFWRTSAEVGAKQAMSIEQGNSKLLVFHAQKPQFGDLGAAMLKEGLPLPGEFGAFVDVTDESTKTGVAVANTLTTVFTMLSGTQGTVRSVQKSALKADPAAYEALALEGARRVGALYARAIGSQKP